MIRSSLLESLTGIRHGFGVRDDVRAGNIVTAGQVHGTEILEVSRVLQDDSRGFDVLVTETPGVAVAVKTADCLPVLIADPRRRIVAAVHAGWKGTWQRVVQKAVRALVERGASLGDLHAALGPNMSGRCYEVGEDVRALMEKEFPGWKLLEPSPSPSPEAKWTLDVSEANRLQLVEAGLANSRIDRLDLCTHCRPDLFHSYRRDAEKAGRMINAIELL